MNTLHNDILWSPHPFYRANTRIEGKVQVDGQLPEQPYQVRAIERRSGAPVGSTFSHPTTGFFRLRYLRDNPVTVIAFDHTETWNAVIADNITPAPIPLEMRAARPSPLGDGPGMYYENEDAI